MIWRVNWMDGLLGLLRGLRTSAVVLSALVLGSTSPLCAVSVQGTTAAVRVHADQAPLSEVLGALGTSFNVRHDALIALDDVIVGGTYSGTLEDVLRRLLAGLNYVLRTRGDSFEIMIVGRPGPALVPEGAPGPPANTNPAAQWRKQALQKP